MPVHLKNLVSSRLYVIQMLQSYYDVPCEYNQLYRLPK